MRKTHELLSRRPFDLYQLHLFRLVAESGSFTGAAQITGLTQSAITRQIQNLEGQLGFQLLVRTTRVVKTTFAGDFIWRESLPIMGDVDVLLRRLREEFSAAPREVRVGVSRSVSLAYLPGFFSANVRPGRSVLSRVSHESSQTILAALESDAFDIGVLAPPPRVSPKLKITHRFRDAFTLLAHAERLAESGIILTKSRQVSHWLKTQPWLGMPQNSQTGKRVSTWLKQQGIHIKPAMELDNFDLIINLVAVGVGVSLVPQRSLALYGRRSSLVRLPWPTRYSRELVVIVRRQRKTPHHIKDFVDNILF